MYKLIGVLLAPLLFTGCGEQSHPDYKVLGDRTIINNLIVLEVEPKDIHNWCPRPAPACYDRTLHRIVIREIETEHDREIFLDLGHEMWHAMGNKHQ